MKRNRLGRGGSSAIEFALVLPVMVTMFIGMTEYTWYSVNQTALNRVVNKAARQAAVIPLEDSPDVEAWQLVQDQLGKAGITLKDDAVTAAVLGDAGDRVLDLSVRVTHAPMTGIFPMPHALVASRTVRMEDQAI